MHRLVSQCIQLLADFFILLFALEEQLFLPPDDLAVREILLEARLTDEHFFLVKVIDFIHGTLHVFEIKVVNHIPLIQIFVHLPCLRLLFFIFKAMQF